MFLEVDETDETAFASLTKYENLLANATNIDRKGNIDVINIDNTNIDNTNFDVINNNSESLSGYYRDEGEGREIGLCHGGVSPFFDNG